PPTHPAGTSTGAAHTFTPLPDPPVVQTEAATALTQAAATLNATVNPSEGSVGDCHFDYGTSTAYGKSAPCAQAPGSGSAPVAVSAALTGLQANATYYFRSSDEHTSELNSRDKHVCRPLPEQTTV